MLAPKLGFPSKQDITQLLDLLVSTALSTIYTAVSLLLLPGQVVSNSWEQVAKLLAIIPPHPLEHLIVRLGPNPSQRPKRNNKMVFKPSQTTTTFRPVTGHLRITPRIKIQNEQLFNHVHFRN